MNTNINFDDSSNAWRQNKIYNGKGYFTYKCAVKECNEQLYCYITQHKLFYSFATQFDLDNKNNSNQFTYCETHLYNK